jgi:hypothetical protein
LRPRELPTGPRVAGGSAPARKLPGIAPRWPPDVSGVAAGRAAMDAVHCANAKVIAGLEAAAHEGVEHALGWSSGGREDNGNTQPETPGDGQAPLNRS